MTTHAGIDEALVVQIWERQAFDVRGLDALSLRVVFRGVPSDAGGPDYQDAILARPDGSLITGDIEFHVVASSWYTHGHANNPRYNRVILHVVWDSDCESTVRSDGATVPTLALRDSVLLTWPVPIADRSSTLLEHPCVGVFRELSSDALVRAVETVGWLRFHNRADLLGAELDADDSDQVAYRALLEGLGHASNRQAFRSLADAVPYGWLMTLPDAERAPALLAGAGLASSTSVVPPARLSPDAWRLTRLRPGNHPARRILAVTGLLDRFKPSLVAGLVDAVTACTRPTEIRRLLMVRAPGDAAIGAGRADELAASAVLPLVAALEPDSPAPRTLFNDYPSPPSTRWTRAMLALLEEAAHTFPVTRALHHQGLHLLHTQYCRRERPPDCPVCGR